MSQKTVVILDPAAGCTNIGDEIISSAVQDVIRECSSDMTRIVRFSVHQKLSRSQLSAIREADLVIAGGSNLINLRFIPLRDARWNNSLRGLLKLRDVWLLGVGWKSYDDSSNWLGRFLYKRAISGTVLHSVRDSFSQDMLRRHGITNVINTACPTMWSLDERLLSRVPKGKSETAVFTLTDYSRDSSQDGLLISAIKRNYRDVFFWPQGFSDLQYLQTFSTDGIKVLRPTLAAFDEILSTSDGIDYVGTRLHAGIRALQHGRRASIVAVDNRASEISRDCGIPVVPREAVDEIDSYIRDDLELRISLPWENIEAWKEQLRKKLA
jgi:polysaccharide pyruvyl transferase WcaK-like protein